MSFIRFRDMMPPARSKPDDALWTQYTIQSSVDGTTWVTFEGPTALSPQYTDPRNPKNYDFSSVDAPVNALYFRLIWTDSNGVEQTTEPLTRPMQLPAWTPSIGDVAEHIPLRTKLGNGTIVGTFTDATKPATADAVTRLIIKAVKRVRPMFDDPISDPKQAETARDLAALWAAMLVELGLFSDQIESEQSPYRQLKEMWDDLTGGGNEGGGLGGDDDDVTGRSASATWNFERRPRLRW